MTRDHHLRQATLGRPATIEGIGAHSGERSVVTLVPAPPGTGCVFRPQMPEGAGPGVRADWRSVSATQLCTQLTGGDGFTVQTVEHLMAALSGLHIDNVIVAIDGRELPILDGSAQAFAAAIVRAGRAEQDAPAESLRVERPVRVEQGGGFAEFVPAPQSRFEIRIDFPEAVIGVQRIEFAPTPEFFSAQIAPARTFGRVSELEQLRAMGFARGSSLDNAIAVAPGGDRVLNPEGLRWPDEFVRHKALDAIGDVALAGAPVVGLFRSYKGGHRLNHAAVCALMADPDNVSRQGGAAA